MILREARHYRQSQHRYARGQPVPKLRRYFHSLFSPGVLFRTSFIRQLKARSGLRIRVYIFLDLQIIQQV